MDVSSEAAAEAHKYVDCIPLTNTLIVRERHPCLLKAIGVKAHRHSYCEKLPDVYICNGETNGNNFS